MLSNDEITELLDKICRSFDVSSVSVKALGLTITTFKVQKLSGTFFYQSQLQAHLLRKSHYCVSIYV
jgi:hypothetical protein